MRRLKKKSPNSRARSLFYSYEALTKLGATKQRFFARLPQQEERGIER